MARLSRVSLVPRPADGRPDPYDPDVRQYIEELGHVDEVPSGVSAVNQVIRDVLDGTADAQLKLVVDQLIFDVMNLERTINEWETKESEWKIKRADHVLSLAGITKDRDDDRARFDREILAKNLEIIDQTRQTEITRIELARVKKDYDDLRHLRAISEAPSTGSVFTNSTHIRKYKGELFDGKAENLERFKNDILMDIRLYPAAFPNDAMKVAYTMSGFDVKPKNWAQQFHRYDPEGVLDGFDKFMKKMDKHFGDPNFKAHQQTKLVNLRQKPTDDILDHICTFEVLCADAGWPESTRSVIFKESLLPSLASKLRTSEVDQDDYEALRQKAVIYDREFQEGKKRGARASGAIAMTGGVTGGPQGKGSRGSSRDSPPLNTVDFTRGHPGRRLNPEELDACKREGRCFRCFDLGHLAPNCPKPLTRPNGSAMNIRNVALVTQVDEQEKEPSR